MDEGKKRWHTTKLVCYRSRSRKSARASAAPWLLVLAFFSSFIDCVPAEKNRLDGVVVFRIEGIKIRRSRDGNLDGHVLMADFAMGGFGRKGMGWDGMGWDGMEFVDRILEGAE